MQQNYKDHVNPLTIHLQDILQATLPLWKELNNKKIFITGGTGFFGCWILESLTFAIDQLKLNIQASILTRNILNFAHKVPHLFMHPSLQFQEGDIEAFEFPANDFAYIIHAAGDVTNSNGFVLNSYLNGTERILQFAKKCQAKLLFISSGAIYGKQPSNISHLEEDTEFFPIAETKSIYTLGKRGAEKLCFAYGEQYGLDIKIARCFTFVGPYLPLDAQFAIGNFIKNALNGAPISVHGDGTAIRSYLYTSDLMIWLWTILIKGQTLRPINVGSDELISIADLASLIAEIFDAKLTVKILKKSQINNIPEQYVPSIKRAKAELNLEVKINLKQALENTRRWHVTFS